jgi:hypothetical protein
VAGGDVVGEHLHEPRHLIFGCGEHTGARECLGQRHYPGEEQVVALGEVGAFMRESGVELAIV